MNPRIRARAFSNLRSGFTLVELLVVILIILVLAAIVVPLAGKLRSSVADTQCLSNLKSWSNVVAMYSSEHGGVIECRNWTSIGRDAPSAYGTISSGKGCLGNLVSSDGEGGVGEDGVGVNGLALM